MWSKKVVLQIIFINLLVGSASAEKIKENNIQAKKENVKSDADEVNILVKQNTYAGEKFPKEYLNAEITVPSYKDLDYYIKGLYRTLRYWTVDFNNTDVNRAIGIYFMTANLKRTLQDYGDRMDNTHVELIKNFITVGREFLSHYIYEKRHRPYNVYEFRIADLFRDDKALIYSLGQFTRNKLKKFIRFKGYMNDYIEEIDAATLPKEKFIDFIVYEDYFIHIGASDFCIHESTYEPDPSNMTELRQCRYNQYCIQEIYSSPSLSYGLSHRMLNIFIYRNMRRCYLVQPEFDAMQLEMLCAYMYREAVYIARRGFFSRDLFLEHIALCGMLGYEEFFRRKWFYKAISWIDHNGCVAENYNHEVNRTTAYVKKFENNPEMKAKMEEIKYRTLMNKCPAHQMALMVELLGVAIRHAVHYISK